MHELFAQVLDKRDLSRAGDLFSVEDQRIVGDLSEVLSKIREIANTTEYSHNDNMQSVVEICLTRVTLCIRDTGTMERHASALVMLLDSCLNHSLHPDKRGDDPPHAKIASDIISSIFIHHNKRCVMSLAIPVAVKFLHRGNRDISHHLASYLSLAAINNADLLAPHAQTIVDSIISGNYSLAKVLQQIYLAKREVIQDHLMALVSLLPRAEMNDRVDLLTLFQLMVKHNPTLFESNLSQLGFCLEEAETCPLVLGIFVEMAAIKPRPLVEYARRACAVAEKQASFVPITAKFLGHVGRVSPDHARDACAFLVNNLSRFQNDPNTQTILLREIKHITDVYPKVFSPQQLDSVCRDCELSSSSTVRFHVQQLRYRPQSSVVTSTTSRSGVDVGRSQDLSSRSSLADYHHHHQQQQQHSKDGINFSSPVTSNNSPNSNSGAFFYPRGATTAAAKSIGHLPLSNVGSSINQSSNARHSPALSQMNRSLSALNTRLSLHNIRLSSGAKTSHNMGPTAAKSISIPALKEESASPPSSPSQFPLSPQAHSTPLQHSTLAHHPTAAHPSTSGFGHPMSSSSTLPPNAHLYHQHYHHSSSNTGITPPVRIRHRNRYNLHSAGSYGGSAGVSGFASPPGYYETIDRRNNNNNALYSNNGTNSSNTNNNNNGASTSTAFATGSSSSSNRLSVFEPMRDGVQHFCEKHLDKIRAYMQTVFVKLPLPAKCTIEERRSRKNAKLHFACQGRGEHCLYSKQLFVMKTKNPRLWIHLMFLALQARASAALSTREASVSSLKNCWDSLKYDQRSFVTVVTSAFPSAKDQDHLIAELRSNRFFDVFAYNAPIGIWGCFLCNHPDKARDFLQSDEPVIEGQLKEKKKKWKLFRQWRPRYFTLSAAALSFRTVSDGQEDDDCGGGGAGETLDMHQIQSVRPISSRGRNIPKAFEIFTPDRTLILKAKDSKNTEQWVQCLSIALARSHAQTRL